MFEPTQAAVRTLDRDWCRSLGRVYLTGCGDSHHAALASEMAFEELAGVPAESLTAMQFARYSAGRLPPGRNLVIGISVSGEVARTVEALRLARRAGAETLALTATGGSRVAQEAGRMLLVTAPLFKEPPGVFTPGVRSYAANLLTLYLTAIWLGEARGALAPEQAAAAARDLLALAGYAKRTIEACDPAAQALAREWQDATEFVFTGSGPNYGTALYSAAKVLEASGDSALGQDTEEWAHLQYFGRAADTPTFIISAGGADVSRAAEVAAAAKAIGRRVAVIAPSRAEALHAQAAWSLALGGAERQRRARTVARARGASEPLADHDRPLEAFSPLVACLPGALVAAHRAEVVGEPYFRGFGGGRSLADGGGASRIRASAIADSR